MPSEVSVMPNWHADRYCVEVVVQRDRAAARRAGRRRPAPAARRGASARARTRRPRRTPLTRIRTTTARSSRAVTRGGRVRARRYFERGRRSWSDCAHRSSAAGCPANASIAGGQVEVGLGEPARAVGGDASGAPCSSRGRGCRGGGWPPRRRPPRALTNAIAAAKSLNSTSRTIASPSRCHSSSAEALVDLLSCQQLCHILASDADRLPRAPRYRDALRARPRRRASSASRTSATTRRRPRELPQVTRDVLPAGPQRRPRSTRPCASGPRGARRSTSSTRTTLRRARARPDRHPGAVPGLRGLLRRRPRVAEQLDPLPAGHRAGPADARRDASATSARSPRRPTRATRALDLVARQRARVDRVRVARQGRAPPPRRRDRVARPGLRRRPLDAAADRAWPAASTCSASPASPPSSGRGSWSPPPSPRSWSASRAATTARVRWPRPSSSATRLRALGAQRDRRARRRRLLLRPGPRLVDGLETLAHALHPDRVTEAPGRVHRVML